MLTTAVVRGVPFQRIVAPSTNPLPITSSVTALPAIAWSGDSGQVQLQFAIPPGLPHSEVDQPEEEENPANGFHFWRLKIDAKVAGVDLERTYPVQVAPAASGSAT